MTGKERPMVRKQDGTEWGTPTRRQVAIALASAALASAMLPAADAQESDNGRPDAIGCANLIYANGKMSRCFAHHFLADAQAQATVWTAKTFTPMKLESPELFRFPFAVMTGEGAFTLTEAQRKNLRDYLMNGGFLVASAGCSSGAWKDSMRHEIAAVFPEFKLETLPMDHPIFHTVYDIRELSTKRRGVTAQLEGLTVEGRIVLVYSADGLNDTANAGGDCCCCGGNEITNARQVNVNLLVYAVTH